MNETWVYPGECQAPRRYISGLSQPLLSIFISTVQESARMAGTGRPNSVTSTSMFLANKTVGLLEQPQRMLLDTKLTAQHCSAHNLIINVSTNKTAGFFEQSQRKLLDTTLHAPQLVSLPALQSTASVDTYKYVPKFGPRISDLT